MIFSAVVCEVVQERRAGVMETVDLLKQLEINYKLISNDLEFASHQLDSRMAAAARL